jgi:hypothetical protein
MKIIQEGKSKSSRNSLASTVWSDLSSYRLDRVFLRVISVCKCCRGIFISVAELRLHIKQSRKQICDKIRTWGLPLRVIYGTTALCCRGCSTCSCLFSVPTGARCYWCVCLCVCADDTPFFVLTSMCISCRPCCFVLLELHLCDDLRSAIHVFLSHSFIIADNAAINGGGVNLRQP